jgi:peptide/nickel transport system substrate-binding protein
MRRVGRQLVFGLLLVTASGCTKGPAAPPSPAILRIGVGALPQQAPQAGLRQVISGLTLEPLITTDDTGRMSPLLAESWKTSPDGLTVTVRLRPHTLFHDGSTVAASAIVASLEKGLPIAMGGAYADVARISASDPLTVTISLRRPSQFLIEALESTIQAPGKAGVGTGAFVQADSASPNTLNANSSHYLGRPAIDEIVVSSYPTVRAAWADLLRGNLDMLNEVNLDALDSLQGATNVNVYSFIRHYQYMIVFGPRAVSLRPPEVRRELSAAIDRDAIIREAMNGHGVPSAGPVSPQHWTMSSLPVGSSSKQLAKNLAGRHLKFTCIVPSDTVYERVALAVKRQLAAVSVDMELQEATQQEASDAFRNGSFDAVLGDIISGPTLFRSFRLWSSQGPALTQKLTSPEIDAALDRINRAVSDDEYRAGVAEYQRAINDAPPALFLAWGERARAVSRRFSVPTPAKNGDVFDIRTIRLWRPVAASPITSTN